MGVVRTRLAGSGSDVLPLLNLYRGAHGERATLPAELCGLTVLIEELQDDPCQHRVRRAVQPRYADGDAYWRVHDRLTNDYTLPRRVLDRGLVAIRAANQ